VSRKGLHHQPRAFSLELDSSASVYNLLLSDYWQRSPQAPHEISLRDPH